MKHRLGIIVLAALAVLQAFSLAFAAFVMRDFSPAAAVVALLGAALSAYACVALVKRHAKAYLAVAAAGVSVLAFFAVMVGRVFALSDDPPATESVLATAMVWIALVLLAAFYVYQTRYDAIAAER
jgi:hypothetical protein